MPVVYMSGVHGSGKSTLLQALLAERSDLVLGPEVALPSLSSFFERQAGRHCRYFLQACSYVHFAQEHPEKIVFGDRCCYDGLAYALAYHKLGWVDASYLARVHQLHDSLFYGSSLPERVIFLDPPLPFIEKNLQKRWQETGTSKWREKDIDYLSYAHVAFREVYASVSSDVLDFTVTHLGERVAAVLDWLNFRD